MSALRTVGILGGMGPQATILLMQKLVDAVPAKDDSDHIPLIIDNNTQVPSRIRHLLEGTGEDPAQVLAQMAVRLQRCGAEALAMPCNTAHHYAPDIRRSVTIPFLDMVSASANAALRVAGPGGTIGLLASPAVQRTGIFDRTLAKIGLEAIYPEDQDAMLAAVRGIKHIGVTEDARRTLRVASTALLGDGAKVQLIACTEFSLIADAANPGAVAIDTLDVLVSEIMRFAGTGAGELAGHRKAG